MRLFLCIAALAWMQLAAATTLRELSGDEQIEQAQAIFRGRVDRADAAFEQTPRGRAIFTTVQFTRGAVYKGDVQPSVSLKFLGGRVGDVEMKIEGMPEFQIGKEYILFVSPGQNRACPVVGWTQGRLEVDRQSDAAGTVPVQGVGDALLRSPAARARIVRPAKLGLPEFEQLLRTRIQQLSTQK
jgi:hypothetical protein